MYPNLSSSASQCPLPAWPAWSVPAQHPDPASPPLMGTAAGRTPTKATAVAPTPMKAALEPTPPKTNADVHTPTTWTVLWTRLPSPPKCPVRLVTLSPVHLTHALISPFWLCCTATNYPRNKTAACFPQGSLRHHFISQRAFTPKCLVFKTISWGKSWGRVARVDGGEDGVISFLHPG